MPMAVAGYGQRPHPQRAGCQLPMLPLLAAASSCLQNMPFIMKSRGLSRAIGMSQLLDTSPEIKVGGGRFWIGAAQWPGACCSAGMACQQAAALDGQACRWPAGAVLPRPQPAPAAAIFPFPAVHH